MTFNSKNPPDLTALLDAVKRSVQMSINCCQIGTIQSFDAATQLATIKIAIKQVVDVLKNGANDIREYPLLLECPVMTLFGGDDFISMPIKAGDSCLILFCDRQIDNWLNVGDAQIPNVGRVHDLSDGIAIVGIRPLTNSIGSILSDGIRISHSGENSKIDLIDDEINTKTVDFNQEGNMTISGGLRVEGVTYGNSTSGDFVFNSDIRQTDSAKSIHAGNGANGTFTTVTVVDGIVVSGS